MREQYCGQIRQTGGAHSLVAGFVEAAYSHLSSPENEKSTRIPVNYNFEAIPLPQVKCSTSSS